MVKKYFSFSEGQGIVFFDTREEAIADANESIHWSHRDGVWDEDEVGSVCWGEVVQTAKESYHEEKPNTENMSVEEAEEVEDRFDGYDYLADYELRNY
jgi:hypothetical protein